MHFRIAAVLAAALAASTAAGQNCPVVTKTELAASCGRRCNNPDCMLVTTIQNPCDCPRAVPTATLIAPCQAECPYNGCGLEVRTLNQPCQPTTTTSRRLPPTTSTTRRATTTTTSTSQSVSWGITLLPPVTSTTRTTSRPAACPTVTQITRPNGCAAIRCPVPNCVQQEQLVLPCGCSGPRTLLEVQGCQTACPEGCMTRTQTVSERC
ncbi:hypothetical protein RB595_005027 [Gaeumannomyces hyphopodioides]